MNKLFKAPIKRLMALSQLNMTVEQLIKTDEFKQSARELQTIKKQGLESDFMNILNQIF